MRRLVAITLLTILVAVVVSRLGRTRPLEPRAMTESTSDASPDDGVTRTVARLDQCFADRWSEQGVAHDGSADNLPIARRLALALAGTIPSLEEIRCLQRLPDAEQADWYLDHLLADRRFSEFLAERLARAYVSSLPAEPFFVYRRRRLVSWLTEQIDANRPYDDLVRELVSAEGIWTQHPATNYITGNERSPNRLASRTARAFLGIRLDCAECHDHPFADWKQSDYRGLAAYFGQVQLGFVGIHDVEREYTVDDPKTDSKKVIPPKLPFGAELVSLRSDRPRVELADWLTHRDNPYFARAICNRIWAILFNQALIEPVDNLQNPPSVPGVLEILADDFRENGHDLRRLIRVIARSKAFRASTSPVREEDVDGHWAHFPVTRLRPEQVAGALAQVSNLSTIDSDSHLVTRFTRFIAENDFVERYGDTPDDELSPKGGKITQRLLMMNGAVVNERIKADLFTSAGHIGSLSPDDATSVEVAYLVCLTRYPTDAERAFFLGWLRGTIQDERKRAMEDLLWALVNSTEFSWNH